MKTLLLAALALVTSVATASADVYDATQAAPQKDRYLGVATTGGASDSLFRLGIIADGGHRIASSVWFIHAQGSTGLSGSLYARGRFTSLRGGLEARRCAGQVTRLCVFGGGDIGVMLDAFTVTAHGETMSAETRMPMVVPRAGVEIGSSIRVRAIAEVPLYGGPDPETGVNVTLGLAYAF